MYTSNLAMTMTRLRVHTPVVPHQAPLARQQR